MIMTGNRGTWSLLDDLVSLQGEFNRIFGDGRAGAGVGRALYPPLNVWQTPDGLVVDAELPGVDPAAVEIAVADGQLAISGQRSTGAEPAEGVACRERPEGSFSRTLQLPFRVNQDQVKASYKQGVLRVELPRAEEDKPKKILVQAA